MILFRLCVDARVKPEHDGIGFGSNGPEKIRQNLRQGLFVALYRQVLVKHGKMGDGGAGGGDKSLSSRHIYCGK